MLHALTIFVSAFLLFLVQPIIAKAILPWFGGSAAVWTTCMLFFQSVLLAGYAYADFTTRHLNPRRQALLHIGLLVASLLLLPILPSAGWKPLGDEDPVSRILLLLTVTLGLPYFLLSTTGPLVQAWFACEQRAGSVYRLFALSNFASLLALVAYPLVIEPFVAGRVQAWGWSAGYVVFVLVCATGAWRAQRYAMPEEPSVAGISADSSGAIVHTAPSGARMLLWLTLSAMGSLLLLAITNHITQNVASVPFLWIVPLILYLLTFILAFDGNWYRRAWWIVPFFVVLPVMAWGLTYQRGVWDIEYAVPTYCAGLFIACMFCHGELAAMKPAPRYLTRFYLMISLGGALGGLAVGVVAPLAFAAYYEFPLALMVLGLVAIWLTVQGARRWRLLLPVTALVVLGAVCFYSYNYWTFSREDTLAMSRNFYGTLRVKQTDKADETAPGTLRKLVHGVIKHGEQFTAVGERPRVTSYYGEPSGIGVALNFFDQPGEARKVGVIGLGVGTLAGYAEANSQRDKFVLYELNPQVLAFARSHFWYVNAAGSSVTPVLGDARLSLERAAPQGFDVLAIDAFSSDSIPVHLVTREAMAAYKRHMKPDGVIAFHITNRYLRLGPVVKQLAEEAGYQALLITHDPPDEEPHLSRTDWVLVTNNKALLASPAAQKFAMPITPIEGLKPWTDDFNNLLSILK